MSRCTRCGHRKSRHDRLYPPYPTGGQRMTMAGWRTFGAGLPCPWYSAPDPWWIHALSWMGGRPTRANRRPRR